MGVSLLFEKWLSASQAKANLHPLAFYTIEFTSPPGYHAAHLLSTFLQHWFNLSDPGAEDTLYESAVLRRFTGVDLGRATTPDETTILNFRHLLEKHELCGKILDTGNLYLDSKGIRISTGTIVDAIIIAAPSSTKNKKKKKKKERDPQMHRTKKGNRNYFGAKAHIGVGSKEGVVHSVCTSAASVHDKHMLPDLLHGEEKKKVWGDAGSQGQAKVIHEAAPRTQDMTDRRVKTKQCVDEDEKRKNRTKSRVRAKVEWPFRILKRVFGFTKVRYRGIKKNHEWLLTAFALVNLYQHRKRLAPRWGHSVSGGRETAFRDAKSGRASHIYF
jgi:IS5 family transposase